MPDRLGGGTGFVSDEPDPVFPQGTGRIPPTRRAVSLGMQESSRFGDSANPGGWLSVSNVVRDYDEEKVKDCKEDIDTLLVFAGLYSAVLSAFIIESYKLLLPDSQDEIIFLLGRLNAKNYAVTTGFLNSTDPAPQLPAFTAPTWAIRVNVLWFSSLVFSLAAASLGMLVKQWLREFLSMDYTLPQERLRARHYRGSALEAWKVYEIAAALPLLLQIALGLFFVGLCYFTEAVHQSIGHTTLPLVSGWAFFIFLTTVAPLISPRCPYKTTFLKHITKSVRRLLFGLLKLCSFMVYTLFATTLFAMIRKMVSLTGGSISFSWILSLLTRGPTRRRGIRRWKPFGFVSHLHRYFSDRYVTVWPQLPDEEEDILARDVDDTDILLDVDVIMPTSGFLTMILDTYREQGTLEREPGRAIMFVLSLIRHRITLKSQVDAGPLGLLSSTLDLRLLSKPDWRAFVGVVTEILDAADNRLGFPIWMQNAAILLLSPSRYQLPEPSVRILRRHLAAGLLPSVLNPLVRNDVSDPAGSADRLTKLVRMCPGEHTDTSLTACTDFLLKIVRGSGAGEVEPSIAFRRHSPVTKGRIVEATITILREGGDLFSSAETAPGPKPWVSGALSILFADTSHSPPPSARGLWTYHPNDGHEKLKFVLSISLGCKGADISNHKSFPSPQYIVPPVMSVLHYYGMRNTSIDLNMSSLSEESWNLLSDLLGQALSAMKHPVETSRLAQAHDALAILLSKSKYDIRPDTRRSLLRLIGHGRFVPELHRYYARSGLFKNSGDVLWYARRIVSLCLESVGMARGTHLPPQLGHAWTTWSGYAANILDQWGTANASGSIESIERGRDAAFLLLENSQFPLSNHAQSNLQAWVAFAPSYLPDHILKTVPHIIPSMHRHMILALRGLICRLLDRPYANISLAFFDLTPLPDNLQTMIIHATAQVLLQHCKPSPAPSYSPWIVDGIMILLSKVGRHRPVASYAMSAICQCIERIPGLPQGIADCLNLSPVSSILPRLADQLSDSKNGLAAMRYAIALHRSPPPSGANEPTLAGPVIAILRGLSARGIAEEEHETLGDLWLAFSHSLNDFILPKPGESALWSPRMLAMLSLANNPRVVPDRAQFYEVILSNSQMASRMLFLCATVHWQDGWNGREFIEEFSKVDATVCRNIIQDVCTHLRQALTTDGPPSLVPLDNCDAIKLCSVCIRLFEAHSHDSQWPKVDKYHEELSQAWSPLWGLLAQLIRRYANREGWKTPYVPKWWHDGDQHLSADDIWGLDHTIAKDECIARMLVINKRSSEDSKMFPFELYSALYPFVPPASPLVDL